SADLGINQIQMRTGGVMTSPISVTVGSRPAPEILGIDCWMAPPGGTINISGRNFASNQAENKVFFGEQAAQITSSSTSEISVIVPNWSWGPNQLNIPISVESNGIRSTHTYPFDIGPMYHGAVPQFGHD
ncbi:MAG: IPT/TIG domain-containing protein, partial [Candidatus Obscuribacterales bacterium]|nr:IPT/TIG domain-containing protein [Candidatus Obscuribacterales bacterium]